MKSIEIQKKMEAYHYWDARVSRLECKCFADEIELAYPYDNDEIV